MNLRQRAGMWLAALLGVSTFAPPPAGVDYGRIATARKQYGGNLAPYSATRTRWYHADLESARRLADGGNIQLAAQLATAFHGDGPLSGLMSTRTNGLIRLPRKFKGRADIVRALEGRGGVRTVFDEMFPPAELAALARDGVELGVGIAELVPIEGRDYPVMVRLDPQFLEYRWNENRWYYNSVAGPIPITPGDGQWILHLPGGRVNPWQYGLCWALGDSYINRIHAKAHQANWEGKLANPARVAVAPQGATEDQAQSWFKKVMAWGVNTVFGMKTGYDVKLLESNGRGFESFTRTIERSEREYAICIAGQVVTVSGGTGFSNQDIHETIKGDIIQGDADALAYTLNTQGLPVFALARFGESALEDLPFIEWDVRKPANLTAEASTLGAAATGIKLLAEALAVSGRKLDVDTICQRFAIPLLGDEDGDGVPELELEVEPDVEDDPANDNADEIDVEFEEEAA